MNFLGMGAMEIIVIMVVALIIFGPEKLPEMGAQAGKVLRDLRNATREMTGEFEESITDVRSAMDEMKMTVADVQRETRDLATSVTEIADSAADEVRAGAQTFNDQTSEISAVVKADPSKNPAATATATRTQTSVAPPSNGGSAEPKKVSKPRQTSKPAVPSKKDPLADLGGFDEEA
jgi:TatA/E family protein of Tat protein translocase